MSLSLLFFFFDLELKPHVRPLLDRMSGRKNVYLNILYVSIINFTIENHKKHDITTM